MILIKSIKRLTDYIRKEKRKGKTVGFVPTMGYLHEGHLSLVRRARRDTDIVVMSVFVNPIQFGPREDFRQYPRDLKRDIRLAKSVGVDVIFCPSIKSMYPKDYSTYVNVGRITDVLCGEFRPGHFKGVTTIVAKLFNIIQPDIAYFGQKDAQQAIVIKRMVKDLNMPINIKVCPIIRERDGLAMSSRNVYLDKDERKDATVLYKALCKAKEMILKGKKKPKVIIQRMKDLILSKPNAKIDYVSIVDIKNLEPVKKIEGELLIALAVWIGKTRLIDNIILKV